MKNELLLCLCFDRDCLGTDRVILVGFSFGGGVAKSGSGLGSISLDWSSQGGFEFGFYVSVWLRFVGQGVVDTGLLTSQTLNITCMYEAADDYASFTAGFVRDGMRVTMTLLAADIGTTWRRLTVGH